MCNFNQGRFRQQIRFLRRQFLQDSDLPFGDVLSTALLTQALAAINVCWKDGIYSPLVTLWFSGGVECGPFMSVSGGTFDCTSNIKWTKPVLVSNRRYCQARKRLPEKFFSDVACQTGRSLETNVKSNWLWKGRHVYIV